ncbi:MAG: DUF4920 domain-containing protein [Xanthomonadales bacterium]|nr:DUF4920 domain-containing protein [Xanthomonadales bacterium]
MRVSIKALITTFTLIVSGTCWAGEVVRLSEPVAETDTHEIFGSPLPESDQILQLAELIGHSDRYLGQEVMVSTQITKVCQKKGCFFIAQDGDAMARITFKDYGFFVPTDSAGKSVMLAGVFSRQELSAEKAQHLAEDMGETPQEPLTAGFEYAIEATSVSIPKS